MSSKHGETPTHPKLCDECQSRLQWSGDGEELFCPECGKIEDFDRVDRGKEWREFGPEDRTKRRTGSPRSPLLLNDGIWSDIGNTRKDANSNYIPIKKRQQINRLRREHKYGKISSPQDRTLEQSLQEIKRVGSALGIPESVLEVASVIQRRVIDEKVIVGRCVESTAGASIYAATRKKNITRSFNEISSVSRVSTKRISRAYLNIKRELELGIPPVSPTEYLSRYISKIKKESNEPIASDCLRQHERRAKRLMEEFFETSCMSGRSPRCVASTAIYAAGLVINQIIPRRLIADATGVNRKVIGEQYRDILRVASDIDVDSIVSGCDGEMFNATEITREIHGVDQATYILHNKN